MIASVIASLASCIVSGMVAWVLWKQQQNQTLLLELESARLELIEATTALAMLTGQRLHEEGILNGQLELANERIRKAKANYSDLKNKLLVK